MIADGMNWERVYIEIDCSSIAEAIWFGISSSSSASSPWYLFCATQIANHNDWQVLLIRREANIAADMAAKQARISGFSWERKKLMHLLFF